MGKNVKPANRDSSGKFIKGKSGNPNGRPKMPEEFVTLARENSIPALKAAIEIMKDETAQHKDRLKASEIIMDRAWGKPTQGLDIEANVNAEVKVKPLDLSVLSDEELDLLEQIILKSDIELEE